MGRKKAKRLRVNKRRLIQLILVCVLLIAAVMLAVTLLNYAKDRQAYAAAQARVVLTPAPTAAHTPAPEATPSPAPLETPPIAVDFEALAEESRHARGWLYSADTVINYPVVYYSNNSYYLEHDYTEKRSSAGALFFDTRSGKELAGDNLIIYGHHMKDRSMFGSLLQYQKQAYYEAHPRMYLLTPGGNFRIELFAARFMDSDPANYPLWFNSPADMERFVGLAVANSSFTPADKEYRPGTRMISLVTCAYSDYVEEAKYVVMGWLEPIG